MTTRDRNAAIAAALILVGFGLIIYMLPVIMLALSDISVYAAVAFVILFLVGPFILLWLRGRSQRRKDGN